MPNKLIDIVGVSKSYGDNLVLDDLNLYIRENEFLTLLGPSGCGKTTLLRILGGFENPDSGKVIFDGKDITSLAPNKRQLNTVFQKYALFTHMTIAENIAFGLKIKGKSKSYIDDKIHYALKLVNLEGYQNRYPDSLSGGQQQRIAIARAIVNEPKVLLLDEPLSAIDALLRRNLQVEIRKIQQSLKMTTIFVTHDQEEAMVMSDTIHLFNVGQIEQSGSPADIYTHPQTKFAANFIGHYNILSNPDLKKLCGLSSDCDFVAIRPEAVLISPETLNDAVHFQGKIIGVMLRGTTISYTIDCDGIELRADTLFETNRQRNMGEMLQLQILKEDILHLH